ncbi:MAG: S-methyl-5'-thioadenosine phosphorylase [Chloroflexi bacterium]|nr:S-methyl-5'-thioadenosine phosphorylase [Chloroflexota bacterium]
MAEATLAFIGGSGLYDIDGLSDRREVTIDTPFGLPSDDIVLGNIGETSVAFLPRHGRGHRISPTELPVRANIFALKTLGVERIVSISAVGSLIEEIGPLDIAVPDQIIDRTGSRVATFFGDGLVVHVGLAEPFCAELSEHLMAAAAEYSEHVHAGGTYVVIEGPQFSTRAESELYRSWGADIIGMTALPEAKLAREAEICYAIMALVTDYDVWSQSEDDVSVALVVANLMQNVETSKSVIRSLANRLPSDRNCACGSALKDAIITSREVIPREAKEKLFPLVGKYLD